MVVRNGRRDGILPERDERRRVLVVDWDEAVCDAIGLALRGRYAVASAPHGAAALDLVKAHDPAFIVIELRLPIMDGWSFLQLYRGAARIIVMSSAADLSKHAQQLGAGELRKPIEIDALRQLFDLNATGDVPARRRDATGSADPPVSA